jgi:hypothetical protein
MFLKASFHIGVRRSIFAVGNFKLFSSFSRLCRLRSTQGIVESNLVIVLSLLFREGNQINFIISFPNNAVCSKDALLPEAIFRKIAFMI